MSIRLQACSRLVVALEQFSKGSQIHSSLITRGFPCSVRTTVAGAFVDLYVKCGHLTEAQIVFDQIKQKNLVSWSSLILGYAQEHNLLQAMDLFRHLRVSVDHQVDEFVLSSLMGVFADFALIEQGKKMHAFTIKIPSGLDILVTNSILDMYLKCGLTDEAERLFYETPMRNVISWTIMITGYGKHGLGRKSFLSFQPDAII
ncbi:hypothetical protein ACFX13_044147 [Malus domestica]